MDKNFTIINGITYLANYKSVSATQLAAKLAGECESLSTRIVEAANNSYNNMGEEFLKLVIEFREQR